MSRLATFAGALALALLSATFARAQAPSYGPSVTLAQAMKAAEAAEAEARKINVNMAIAIVDTGGLLVYFRRMDDTQTGSVNIAIGKARSAAMFRRPTNAFNEALSKGNTYVLGLEGANVVPGGMPMANGGKIIGGVGISGGTGAEDTQVAQAAASAMK